MNITPRSAAQLRAIDPTSVAAILDHLRERSFPERESSSLVEVDAPGGTFRAFIARHKNGDLVLIAVVTSRPRAP